MRQRFGKVFVLTSGMAFPGLLQADAIQPAPAVTTGAFAVAMAAQPWFWVPVAALAAAAAALLMFRHLAAACAAWPQHAGVRAIWSGPEPSTARLRR